MFFRIAYKDNFLHVTSIWSTHNDHFLLSLQRPIFSKEEKEDIFKLKRLDISSFKISLALNEARRRDIKKTFITFHNYVLPKMLEIFLPIIRI